MSKNEDGSEKPRAHIHVTISVESEDGEALYEHKQWVEDHDTAVDLAMQVKAVAGSLPEA